jgi:hypothetical protein
MEIPWVSENGKAHYRRRPVARQSARAVVAAGPAQAYDARRLNYRGEQAMDAPNLQVASLSPDQLEKLNALEQKLGTILVAYEQKYRFADLTDEQVALLQQAEREMGVTLLAYEEK